MYVNQAACFRDSWGKKDSAEAFVVEFDQLNSGMKNRGPKNLIQTHEFIENKAKIKKS